MFNSSRCTKCYSQHKHNDTMYRVHCRCKLATFHYSKAHFIMIWAHYYACNIFRAFCAFWQFLSQQDNYWHSKTLKHLLSIHGYQIIKLWTCPLCATVLLVFAVLCHETKWVQRVKSSVSAEIRCLYRALLQTAAFFRCISIQGRRYIRCAQM